jgi:hypothetical protein
MKPSVFLSSQNIDYYTPVERRLIVVNGSEVQVYIDEVGADVEAAVDASVAAGGTTAATTTGCEGGGGQQTRAARHSRNEILGLCSQQRVTQHWMKQLQLVGDERQLDYLQGSRGEESRCIIVGAGLCGILWLT